MCGFSGYLNFNFNISKIEQKKIIEASKFLAHRGPDKTTNFIHENLCVVFHRLSIIELSSNSNQPFYKDKNLILLFNGEIYNYKQLISKFKNQISVNSISDTELIYELYKLKGNDFINYLQGMYSIVIVDLKNKKSFFVRDNDGIKPLYYTKSKGGLYFSSELRFFKHIGYNTFNNLQIFSFLYLGYTIEPQTYLKNILSLVKNKFLIYEKSENLYIKENINIRSISNNDELINNLKKNILKHEVSDVKGTILFSGGYDSYFILKTFLEKKGENNVNSLININFFNTNKFDDMNSDFLKQKLNSYNFKSHFPFYSIESFINDTEIFLKNMDQPTIDGINTYILTKLVNKMGYKYAISGLGADELFDGYNLMKKYGIMKIFSLISRNLPQFMKKELASKLLKNKRKVLSTFSSNILSNYLSLRSLRTDYDLNEIYNVEEINKFKCELVNYINLNYNFETTNLRNNILSIDKDLYMTNQILKNTDWISMLNSVEIRVPYIFNNFHSTILNSKNSFTKKNTIGIGYEKFYKKKYKKVGFSFPIENYLKNKNYSISGNPLKKWSTIVLKESFGIEL